MIVVPFHQRQTYPPPEVSNTNRKFCAVAHYGAAEGLLLTKPLVPTKLAAAAIDLLKIENRG